eukprot:6816814-Pyramimonas_sp.AAC.1
MDPAGHVAIRRARRADDFIIALPFSPALFRQGGRTGPRFLRSLTAGERATEKAKAGWATAEEEAAAS